MTLQMNICGPYWADFPFSSKCRGPHVKGAGDSQLAKQKGIGEMKKRKNNKVLYCATSGSRLPCIAHGCCYNSCWKEVEPNFSCFFCPFSLLVEGINAVTFCSHPSFVTLQLLTQHRFSQQTHIECKSGKSWCLAPHSSDWGVTKWFLPLGMQAKNTGGCWGRGKVLWKWSLWTAAAKWHSGEQCGSRPGSKNNEQCTAIMQKVCLTRFSLLRMRSILKRTLFTFIIYVQIPCPN